MVWYNYGKYFLLKQNDATSSIDLLADTINAALMTSTYSPTIDTEDFWDDVSASELDATNYTVGGLALGTKTITCDTTNDRAEFDAADCVHSSLGGISNDTIGSIVLYKDTGADGTSTLIACATITPILTDGGTITIVWNSEGILHLS